MATAFCNDLGDELETHIMQLEHDSVDDEWGAAACKWMSDPDLSLLSSQDPFSSVAITAPLQGLDTSMDGLWGGGPTTSLLSGPAKVHWAPRGSGNEYAIPRSLSAGNVPGTARAPCINNSLFIPAKSELEIDTGVTPGWMNAHTSNHPLSNHCPGATNIELIEAPEDITGQQQPLTGGRATTTQNSLPPMDEHRRMAEVGSITASWLVQGSSVCGGSAGTSTPLPSSFMIVNDTNTCWTDTSSGLSGGHHDGPSMGACSSAGTNNGTNDGQHHHPGDSRQEGDEDRTGSHRALRATRSMPNFRHMANGTGSVNVNSGTGYPGGSAPIHIPTRPASAAPPPVEMPNSAGNNNSVCRKVIIHRWPSSNSGPTMARKSRAAEELARSSGQFGGKAGAGGNLQISASCHSSGTSLTDLASPLSNSGLSSGHRLLSSGEFTDGDIHGRAASADGTGAATAGAPPRHHHNLRGRGHQSQGGNAPEGGSGWLTGEINNGIRTSRLPEVPPPQTHNGKKRGASGGPGSTCARPVPHPCGHVCTACGTSVTPVWRAGPQGPKTLCNACGVRYMKVAKKK